MNNTIFRLYWMV